MLFGPSHHPEWSNDHSTAQYRSVLGFTRIVLTRYRRAHPRSSYIAHSLAGSPPRVEARALPEMLTRCAVEILALLAKRWSNQEIAEQLIISTNTVRKHTSTICHKLGVGGHCPGSRSVASPLPELLHFV
jgi:DNA-binding NarL/FixJ family response regulator